MPFYLAILVLATWCLGLFLVACRRAVWARRAELASGSGLALAALPLAFLSRFWDTSLQFVWIGNMEPVGLSYHAPGVHLATMTYGALATSLWLAARSPGNDAAPPPGALHLLCGLVVAALTVDHLLARIVLLDLTAVAVAVALFYATALSGAQYPLLRRYLVFRLGDMGLMLMALLLWRVADTWLIEAMFARAHTLHALPRAMAALGGLVAVAVKLGLPPFHRWFYDAARLPRPLALWLTGAVLPLLGAYLAYRMRPLLVGQPMGIAATALGIVLAVWSLLRAHRPGRPPTVDAGSILNAHNALALALVQTNMMRAYVLTFLPVRAALYLSLTVPSMTMPTLREIPSDQLPAGLRVLVRAATVGEEGLLDRVNDRLAAATLALAQWTATHLDVHIDRNQDRVVARVVHQISAFLEHHHSGLLRRNMLWASMGLVVLIIAIVSWHCV